RPGDWIFAGPVPRAGCPPTAPDPRVVGGCRPVGRGVGKLHVRPANVRGPGAVASGTRITAAVPSSAAELRQQGFDRPSTHRRDSMRTTTIVAGATGPATAADQPMVPAHAMPHRTPAELLALARRGLAEAEHQRADGLRYA